MVARGDTVAERVARLEYKMDVLADRSDALIAEQAAKIVKLEAFVDCFDATRHALRRGAPEDELETLSVETAAARLALEWKPNP